MAQFFAEHAVRYAVTKIGEKLVERPTKYLKGVVRRAIHSRANTQYEDYLRGRGHRARGELASANPSQLTLYEAHSEPSISLDSASVVGSLSDHDPFLSITDSHNNASVSGGPPRKPPGMPRKYTSAKRSRKHRVTKTNRFKEIKKAVTRAVQSKVELKSVRLNYDETTVHPSGDVVFLGPNLGGAIFNFCAQGTDFNQRTGLQVKEIGLDIKGKVCMDPAAATAVQGCIRIMVIRDHDTKGAVPVASDLFEPTTQPFGILEDYTMAQLRWINRKRFSVLHDSCSTVVGNVLDQNQMREFSISLKLGKTLTFQSNTNDYSTVNDGGLYLVVTTNGQALAGDAPWRIAYTSAFYYKDV